MKSEHPLIREAVASFADRDHFHRAVGDLLAAGFAPSDISVLASHQSLEAAGEAAGDSDRGKDGWLPAGLADEINWIGPLTIAGIIVISGGPLAASIAAVVGAGLGGAALKEILDRFTGSHHHEEFAAALKAGAVLLWVRCEDKEREARATRLLAAAGGRFVHMHEHPAGERASG